MLQYTKPALLNMWNAYHRYVKWCQRVRGKGVRGTNKIEKVQLVELKKT